MYLSPYLISCVKWMCCMPICPARYLSIGCGCPYYLCMTRHAGTVPLTPFLVGKTLQRLVSVEGSTDPPECDGNWVTAMTLKVPCRMWILKNIWLWNSGVVCTATARSAFVTSTVFQGGPHFDSPHQDDIKLWIQIPTNRITVLKSVAKWYVP
jgi:hypothetical protein